MLEQESNTPEQPNQERWSQVEPVPFEGLISEIVPVDSIRVVEGSDQRQAIRERGEYAVRMAKTEHSNRMLSQENEELASSNEQLSLEASTDALTGLANRRVLLETMDRVFEEVEKDGREQPKVLFIDLDNFKKANDVIGYKTGDEILKLVAQRVSEQLKVRENEDEILARLGGDEFVALIFPDNAGNDQRDKNKTKEEIINGFIERTSKIVSEIASELNAPFVGASIGVTERQEGESAEELLDRAGKLMHAEKEQRKAENPELNFSR